MDSKIYKDLELLTADLQNLTRSAGWVEVTCSAAAIACVLDEIKRLQKFEERLHWLHDCSTGQFDREGCEWGIYRVKWVNGQPTEVWQTNSDFSDLDAEIERTKPPNVSAEARDP
jgi:hypothetical protein